MFQKDKLFQQYDEGVVSRDLLLTIFIVTAKILGTSNSWKLTDVDDCLNALLARNPLQGEGLSGQLSLDNFKQACLLAFYAFHQYPGEAAWERVGQLARKAYQCGLNQIDNLDQYEPAFDRQYMSDTEVEEWRYVWWCIYCLDSYSNITTATPFVVENESVRTALVTTPLADLSNSELNVSNPRFLPADTSLLWKITKEITNSKGEINFNIHIVTTTLLREAATIQRLRIQNPSERLQSRHIALENHLSAVRLALPARFLNGARNVMVDETSASHHARLVCVLHLHAARMLLSLPFNLQADETEWASRWQQTLEYSEDIVSVVRKWDSQFCSTVDPALCFIILGALMLLHLHTINSSSDQPELQARLTTSKDVLLLFLEQFASTWQLPRALIGRKTLALK